MRSVTVVDYGMGNLKSILMAMSEIGAEAIISSDVGVVQAAKRLIIPGVGSFADGMKNLRTLGLVEAIQKLSLHDNRPLLGICLGMQLLASKGYEGEECEGLKIIPGEAKRLVPKSPNQRIPHVGWNDVRLKKENALFANIPDLSDFYFVHGYHLVPSDKSHIVGTTDYCGDIVSVVNNRNTWGVQFHPEKSGPLGYRLLKNFIEY